MLAGDNRSVGVPLPLRHACHVLAEGGGLLVRVVGRGDRDDVSDQFLVVGILEQRDQALGDPCGALTSSSVEADVIFSYSSPLAVRGSGRRVRA